MKRIFRPVYGERCEVRPKHWWSRKQRRAARLAARLLDYELERVAQAAALGFARPLFWCAVKTAWESAADAPTAR